MRKRWDATMWDVMSQQQRLAAQRYFAEDYPDGDLLVEIEHGQSAVAAFYVRAGLLGYRPRDGE